MSYRFSFDMGTTSIGYSVIELDDNNTPKSLVALGSHIFSDGRESVNDGCKPLNVKRHTARLSRRQHRRFLRRRNALISYLQSNNWLYGENEQLLQTKLLQENPYRLRAKALSVCLTEYELGRIFLSLNNHRGYQKTISILDSKRISLNDDVIETSSNEDDKDKDIDGIVLKGLDDSKNVLDTIWQVKDVNVHTGKVLSGNTYPIEKKFATLGEFLWYVTFRGIQMINEYESKHFQATHSKGKCSEADYAICASLISKKENLKRLIEEGKDKQEKYSKELIEIKQKLLEYDPKYLDVLYPLYYSRQMYRKEFTVIKEKQLYLYKKELVSQELSVRVINRKLKKRKRVFEKVYDILYYQRPLRSQNVGKCKYVEGKFHCSHCSPYFHKYRILQDIHHIKVFSKDQPNVSQDLLVEVRNRLFDWMWSCTTTDFIEKQVLGGISYKEIEKKIKKLYKKFDIEVIDINYSETTEKTKKFYPNQIGYMIKKELGEDWCKKHLEDDIQKWDEFISFFLNEQKEFLEKTFLSENWGLTCKKVDSCLDILGNFYGEYASMSKEAMIAIMDVLEDKVVSDDRVIPIAEAMKILEYHTSIISKGKSILPYYGKVLSHYCVSNKDEDDINKLRKSVEDVKNQKSGASSYALNDLQSRLEEAEFGKISNPTVHVALRQLQKIGNALITTYGRPKEVVFEVARELGKGQKGLSSSSRVSDQNRRTSYNDFVKERIKTNCNATSRCEFEWYMKKYKLWLELPFADESKRKINALGISYKNGSNEVIVSSNTFCDRVCPYTLECISEKDVFDDGTHIDHIIPKGKHYDNTNNNLLLCKKGANLNKEKKTPYEFLGNSSRWKEIYSAVENSGLNSKLWRFEKNADVVSRKKSKGLSSDIPLTAYMTKVACLYFFCLDDISSDDISIENTQKLEEYTSSTNSFSVWSTVGEATAFIRNRWGLNALLNPDEKDKKKKFAKNRRDHRHHATDAFVLGMMNRSMKQLLGERKNSLERCATFDSYKKCYNEYERKIEKCDSFELSDDMKTQLETFLSKNIVSFKRDISKYNSALHDDTAYSPYNEDNCVIIDGVSYMRVSCSVSNLLNIYTEEEISLLRSFEGSDSSDNSAKNKIEELVSRIRHNKVRSQFFGMLQKGNIDIESFRDSLQSVSGLHNLTVLYPKVKVDSCPYVHRKDMIFKTQKMSNVYKAKQKDSVVPVSRFKTNGNWAYEVYGTKDDKGKYVIEKAEAISYSDIHTLGDRYVPNWKVKLKESILNEDKKVQKKEEEILELENQIAVLKDSVSKKDKRNVMLKLKKKEKLELELYRLVENKDERAKLLELGVIFHLYQDDVIELGTLETKKNTIKSGFYRIVKMSSDSIKVASTNEVMGSNAEYQISLGSSNFKKCFIQRIFSRIGNCTIV